MTTPALRIAGYAALFGIADAARDTINPGAFARTLTERHEPLPLCWQHRQNCRIGTVEQAQEDDHGLRIIARLESEASHAAYALRSKTISGLSFGYRTKAFRLLPSGRLLEQIDLIEISLVTMPLQHRARVHLISEESVP